VRLIQKWLNAGVLEKGIGPERMLERAKSDGLLVLLQGYTIHVQGASPNGLSLQAWVTVKKFWDMYFVATGAQLVEYSSECGVNCYPPLSFP